NKFSLHAAYRMRIVRTFLGASRGNARHANAFTGFDPLDDMQMHELRPALVREGDIHDIEALIQTLRQALEKAPAATDPVQCLASRMCSPDFDPSSMLSARLKNARAGTPVLKSLQQDVQETLNRVLESGRLDEAPAFVDLEKKADDKKAFAE